MTILGLRVENLVFTSHTNTNTNVTDNPNFSKAETGIYASASDQNSVPS